MNEVQQANEHIEQMRQSISVLEEIMAETNRQIDHYKEMRSKAHSKIAELTTHCVVCQHRMYEAKHKSQGGRRRYSRYCCYTCYKRMQKAYERQRETPEKLKARQYCIRHGADDLLDMLGLSIVPEPKVGK